MLPFLVIPRAAQNTAQLGKLDLENSPESKGHSPFFFFPFLMVILRMTLSKSYCSISWKPSGTITFENIYLSLLSKMETHTTHNSQLLPVGLLVSLLAMLRISVRCWVLPFLSCSQPVTKTQALPEVRTQFLDDTEDGTQAIRFCPQGQYYREHM